MTLPLSAPAQGEMVLGIRPESVRVAQNGTPARVFAAEPMGREVLYSADSPLGVVRFIEAGAEARHREGDNVSLAFAPEDTLLFDKASGRRIGAHVR
jgi:inositol-phosphate transport system ATP-binding protein